MHTWAWRRREGIEERREEKKMDIDIFTHGEEEEEEEKSLVCYEIIDSRLFIGVFYKRIIKY